MSLVTVNSHVLFPVPPNWRDPVGWKRSWQTEISAALEGQEARRSLRRVPRVTLNWLATASTAEDSSLLEACVKAALKTGLACAGYWGHACELSAAVTSNVAVLHPSAWPWAIGDYILFADPDTGAFDAILVDDVDVASDAVTLTLHAAVSQTRPACSLVWPIIFGKLTVVPLEPATADNFDVRLTLNNALPTPCQVPDRADWCGHCAADLDPILAVEDPPCLALSLDDTLPNGQAGVAYAGTVTVTGGVTPFLSIVKTSGSYPPGFVPTPNLAAGTLVFSGTPTTPGDYNFTVTGTDANGCTGSCAYSVTIACPTITLNDTLPDGAVGVAYSGTIAVTGGATPYQSIEKTSGTYPPGLTPTPNLAAGTLALAGTPTTSGDYTFTITGTDANGCTGARAYSICINSARVTNCGACPGGIPSAVLIELINPSSQVIKSVVANQYAGQGSYYENCGWHWDDGNAQLMEVFFNHPAPLIDTWIGYVQVDELGYIDEWVGSDVGCTFLGDYTPGQGGAEGWILRVSELCS